VLLLLSLHSRINMAQQSQDGFSVSSSQLESSYLYLSDLGGSYSLAPNLRNPFGLNSLSSFGGNTSSLLTTEDVFSSSDYSSIPTINVQVSPSDLNLLGSSNLEAWENFKSKETAGSFGKLFSVGDFTSREWVDVTNNSDASSKLEVLFENLAGQYWEQARSSQLLQGSIEIDISSRDFIQLNAFLEKIGFTQPLPTQLAPSDYFQATSKYDASFNHGFLAGYRFASQNQLNLFQSEIGSSSSKQTTINITQFFMSNINQYGFGDNIAGDKVMGDKIETQIINPQDLAQAAKEIANILIQLSIDYPTDTPRVLAAKAVDQVDKAPEMKARILREVRAGSFAALEKMIDHPVAKFFIEGAKEALKP
jgi:hypothetical protein